MVTRLLEAPNPDDPEIAERTVGENQAFLIDRLTTLRAMGQALRFDRAYRYSVESVSISDAGATVRDCTIDSARTVAVTTNSVVSQGTSTELLEATLVLEGDNWRVQTVNNVQSWPGVAPCDG